MIARRPILTTLLAGAAGLVRPARAARADTGSPQAAKAAMEAAIWRTFYLDTRVWGYVDRHSIDPGETFDLMLSTGPNLKGCKGNVEIYRIGYYPDGDRTLVWRSEMVEVFQQPVQVTAATVGAGWRTSIEQIGTENWRSGYHTIDFIDASDGLRNLNIASIIITDKDRSGDLLLELSSNTWQAYNTWGGYSFYESDFVGTNAQMISFDRPTPPDFFEYEYYLALWLERFAAEHNLKLDYATNFDVHRDAAFTERYRLFVSGSHNEYWSLEEFEAVHRRIFELGRNTIFMGANTAYWQVRYADVNGAGTGAFRGRQLICFKSSNDPVRFRGDERASLDLVTMRFRDEARRPETMLMGVGYQSWFSPEIVPPIRYPYFVARNDLPFFAGTGYEVGDRVGDLVGYEWDNTDPDGDGRRLWDAQKSRIPPIDPASIKVLFTGSPVDVDGKQGKAEAVYFASPAGAKVFSSGSIRWALGFGAPGFEEERFKAFNRNLLKHFLQPA
jgi:hypothetical protein